MTRHRLTAGLREDISKDAAVDMNEHHKEMSCVYSKPVKAYQNAAAEHRPMEYGNINAAPNRGCRASRYSHELWMVCGIRGVMHSCGMTAEGVHAVRCLEGIRWEHQDYLMSGSKCYLGDQVWQNFFDAADITIEIPY